MPISVSCIVLSGNVKTQIITSCIVDLSDLCWNITWSPQVQRQFTKRLYGFKHLSYKDRLTKLGISSLELRRLLGPHVLL